MEAKALQAVINIVTAKLAETNEQIAKRVAEDSTAATLKAVGFKDVERLVLTLQSAATMIDRREFLESALVKLSATLASLTPAMSIEEAKEKLQELIAVCTKFDQLVVTAPAEVIETLVDSSIKLDTTAGIEYSHKFDKMLTFNLSDVAKEIKNVRRSYSDEHVTAIKARISREKQEAQAKRHAETRDIPTPEEYSMQRAEKLAEQQKSWTPEQWADYNKKARAAGEKLVAELENRQNFDTPAGDKGEGYATPFQEMANERGPRPSVLDSDWSV